MKETPAMRITRLETELKALKTSLKTEKIQAHSAEIKATDALVKWLDTDPMGKKFAKAHYQTNVKAHFALSKGGYIGEWAFTLARTAGFTC
jgi:cytochrome c